MYLWPELHSWDVHPNCLLIWLRSWSSVALVRFSSHLLRSHEMRKQREVDMWPCSLQETLRTQRDRLFKERKPLIIFNTGYQTGCLPQFLRILKECEIGQHINPFHVFCLLLAHFLSFKNLCVYDTCMSSMAHVHMFMCVSSTVHVCQHSYGGLRTALGVDPHLV